MLGRGFRSTAGLAGLLWVGAVFANLVPNPGFEEVSGDAPASWSITSRISQNSISLDSDAHSGGYALKLHAMEPESPPGYSMGARSPAFDLPAHALVRATAAIKARNVRQCAGLTADECREHFQLRVVLYAYDSAGVEVAHWDFVSTDGDLCEWEADGTCGWKQVQTSVLMPDGTRTGRIAVWLTSSTGDVWVDDVGVEVLHEVPTVDSEGIHNPVLVPLPRELRNGAVRLPFESAAVLGAGDNARLREEMTEFFAAKGLQIDFDPSNPAAYSGVVYVGSGDNSVIADQLSARFPSKNWSQLGNQGYFLSVSSANGQTVVHLGGNAEQGRFYAFQTMKQLITAGEIHAVDVFDWPEVRRRGHFMGIQWFGQRGTAIDRLARLKLNFVWNEGSFLNHKFDRDWRVAFSAAELNVLRSYIELCDRHFIDLYMSIRPRAQTTDVSASNPPVEYSAQDEVDTIVAKMSALYQLGQRNFALNFDDMQNTREHVLLHETDRQEYGGDIGLAQQSFIRRVYEALLVLHPDARFMVFPMRYGGFHRYGDNHKAYLEKLRDLPPAIEILTAAETDSDLDVLYGFVQPPTFIASNYYATRYSANGATYVVPFHPGFEWSNARASGFMFLPNLPTTEDRALVSWKSMADFAWRGSLYDPISAFQRSAAQYLGASDHDPVVSDPVIAPAEAVFLEEATITLSTTTPGAELYYTTDGSEPTLDRVTPSSTANLYAGPFLLTGPAVIKVWGSRAGYQASEVVSAAYARVAVAKSERRVHGSVDGSFQATGASDNVYQTIGEVRAPAPARLEHEWRLASTGGGRITLYMEAFRAPEAGNDQFVVEYSSDGAVYLPMFVIDKTFDDDVPYGFELPAGLRGDIVVRIVDSNRHPSDKALDAVNVDHLYLYSE